MKIVRVRLLGGEIAYGAVEPEGIRVHRGTPFVAWEPTETLVPFDQAHLLAPVFPTKVVGVGRNYAGHAAERGVEVPAEPVIFLKPATAVIGPGASVVLPLEAKEVHHEAELAVVVGRVAHRVAAEDAGGFILGYTAANDVSARDLQKQDGQWARAKGFDTFCPLGPAIETELDPTGLSISCTVNGEIRQEANTADMVFGVAELFAFISRVMTLLPGDVILTGTPAGTTAVRPGDHMEVQIERIGALRNPVVAGR
ncbi:MAG: fumarylacetoacetate hydrolase family protein [Acidimicrobiia bacterium]|jgi:2-keto-4-pentenoate hydratase/2-oxohepta-3-ene-1,7-dioic acid hydratase in catechol pathway|nr:fumarylacetoacetate hydrolase family protein [Acidimicrobiia bacterium]